MLYLTRKIGEGIRINNSIIITVKEIKGKNVRLGFVFPKGNSVLREELYAAICRENQEAMTQTSLPNLD